MFRVHLRQERGALLGWGIGLFAYLLVIGLSYAAIAGNEESYDELWESLPEGMREAFGGTSSITSVDGFIVSQATSYLPLILGLYAVAAATKRTAGAEESGLLDHLLGRPVTRRHYLGSLALTLATTMVAVIAASTLGAVLGMAASGVGAADLGRMSLLFLDIVPISLTFLAIGLMLGTFMHRRSPAFGMGLVVVIGTFALQILAKLVDGLSWLEWVTPFGLWGRSDAFHGDVEPVYYIVSVLLIAAAGAVAAWRFRTKDLYA